MADITRRLFLRHLRGTPTTWIRHVAGGDARHVGTGLAFWYLPLTAVLSEVPVDDRELPLLFHARTSDFADVTVQATVTYRIVDPAAAASRLDFAIDPHSGAWRAQPLDQIATLLAELAQQPAMDLIAHIPLTEALTSAIAPVRDAVSALLATDARLAEIGVGVVSARVVAIRPEPELERALQTPTRESVQQAADRATYERRAKAVERERAIAENELQTKIELARREEQLVEQQGANARRQAELEAARARVVAEAEADAERVRAQAQAAGVEALRLAEAAGEVARLAAYRDLPAGVIQALAAKDLAGSLPRIGQLTVTPDVLTGLLARLGGNGAAPHDHGGEPEVPTQRARRRGISGDTSG